MLPSTTNPPFNLSWLAENFNFNPLDVESAKFVDFELGYEVTFKPEKKDITKLFSDILISRGCHPRYSEEDNTVWLNTYQKEKIMSAAKKAHILPSSPKPKELSQFNHLDLVASQDLLRPAPRVDLSFNAAIPQKKTEPPFDLLWLKENYQLDVKQVKTAQFSSVYGCGFNIVFEPNSHLVRNAFIAALTEAGCKPEYNKFDNTVELTQRQKENIISGSTRGKAFIPPIENEEAIDSTLRKAILLVKFFLDVLPAARSIKQYESQDYKPGFELRDVYYKEEVGCRENYAKKQRFLKEIEPDLSFINGILSDPDYKKKLEYYFITEENLISLFERFVKNKSGSLSLSLDNAC